MTTIPVAEHFYTVQGEGPYVGTPAVFLRTAGCNLRCGATESDLSDVDEGFEPDGDATWRCDTIEVWRSPDATPTVAELGERFHSKGWLDRLDGTAHLVLTGGEPMLPARQQQLAVFLSWMQTEHDITPFVEVETNGTIPPMDGLDSWVDQYNVSMKLSNSGHTHDKRVNSDAIQAYIQRHRDDDRAVFKFVVSRAEDVAEVHRIQDEHNIPDSTILLMPAGMTQTQLGETYGTVVDLCMDEGWRFSQRLHVELWNEKTGV